MQGRTDPPSALDTADEAAALRRKNQEVIKNGLVLRSWPMLVKRPWPG